MKKKSLLSALVVLAFATSVTVSLYSCSGESKKEANDETTANTESEHHEEEAKEETDPMKNKGIGPVKSVTLAGIDDAMADKGKTLFEGKCTACHKLEAKVVGPALKDITKRRTPEWIMNMALNPSEMTQKDPIAKELLAQYIAPMANQSLTEDEARSILEYFRKSDK